jgi:hypothetical protein
MSERDDFFANLPELVRFADVADPTNYVEVPRDWLMVITDVRGSTKAIEAGRYRDVNALGASSIIALRNAFPRVDLPFVFGGDGATLLVPGSLGEACQTALRGVRSMARSAFDMSLRCGVVPVSQLLDAGQRVLVSRFRVSPHVVLAMFTGDGFVTAERWVKDPARAPEFEVSESGPADCDLTGFECRWQPVKSSRGSIVSLLVTALTSNEARKGAVYRLLIGELESILGEEGGHPVSRRQLSIGGPFADYSTEARVRSGAATGDSNRAAFNEARKRSTIGKALMAFGSSAGGFDGASYPNELVANSDFRKFDDTLRMVVDVSPAQLSAIETVLRLAHERGDVAYGMHRSKQALLTCFVRAYAGDHVHFVDGSHGGYALAAKQLKAQLQLAGSH